MLSVHCYGLHSTGGQTCIDVVDDVQQAFNDVISPDRTVIVPRLNFTCNGRIANIRVGINIATEVLMNHDNTGTNFPYIQVWRQPPTSQLYSLVDSIQIQSNHLNTQLANLEAVIPLIGNKTIQFLSGDVIGFYNPPDSGYVIRDIRTPGYVFYIFEQSNASSLNLSTGITRSERQPSIQFNIGEYGDSHLFVDYYTLQYHMSICRYSSVCFILCLN